MSDPSRYYSLVAMMAIATAILKFFRRMTGVGSRRRMQRVNFHRQDAIESGRRAQTARERLEATIHHLDRWR